MPFVQVTQKMAERRASRRKTRQQYEIESLSSSTRGVQAAAQAEQQKALKEYQKMLSQYDTEQTAYEQGILDYQDRASEYEDRISSYNQAADKFNTLTPALNVRFSPYGDQFVYNADVYGIESTRQALANAPAEVRSAVTERGSTGGVDFYLNQNKLPSNYVVSDGVLKRRGGPDPGGVPPPFGETFTMQSPEVPTADGVSQANLRAKQAIEKQKDFVEREIGERKAGSLRARRRMTDRTMLQRS